MRKLVYILLAAVLTVSLAVISAQAAGGAQLTITTDKAEVHPGDTVTFTFAVSNPAKSPVAGLQYTVDLPTGLTYKSHELLCEKYFGAANYNAAAANLFVTNTATLEGMTEAAWQVMTITCDVARDITLGTKTISLSEVSFYGGVDLTDIPYTPGTASVKVTHTDEQHVWDAEHSKVTKEAGCAEQGERTYTCAVDGCGKTKTETIEALGHDYKVSETNATCTKPGVSTYTCSRCGDSYTETGKALGHSYGEWVTDQEATCTEPGSRHRDCVNDCCTVADETAREEGWRQTEAIPVIPHEKGEVASHTEATCTEEGITTYQCAMCGEVISDWTETEPALGHAKPEDESLIETVKEATCTETGEVKYICTRCGEEQTEEVPALGHAWDEGKVTKEPTAAEKGVRTFTCTRCGETKTETIPAKGSSGGGTGSGSGQSGAPKTGDETPLTLYAGLLALSLAGLGLVLGWKKRTEK